jgi:hypothetical protein
MMEALATHSISKVSNSLSSPTPLSMLEETCIMMNMTTTSRYEASTLINAHISPVGDDASAIGSESYAPSRNMFQYADYKALLDKEVLLGESRRVRH